MKPLIPLLLCALVAPQAHAWGSQGHQVVGALAEHLIAGKPAAAKVAALLGGLTLGEAALWADCAKGVDPQQDYKYRVNTRFEECRRFESPEGIAEMEDFVRRNDVNCPRHTGDESCHKQYHYTDTAIQRSRYQLGDHGTRSDDVVGAIQAATAVLKGQPAPAPFQIKSPREALLLLAHYVGDVHQPLHVGAVYLSDQGRRLDPKKGSVDESSDTRGGNAIYIVGKKKAPVPPTPAFGTDPAGFAPGFAPGPVRMHSVWDAVPSSMELNDVDAEWIAEAKRVRRTRGPVSTWPAQWATGTLHQAAAAFKGLRFSAKDDGHWDTQLPDGYNAKSSAIKHRQLTLAGARLAQVLMAVFP